MSLDNSHYKNHGEFSFSNKRQPAKKEMKIDNQDLNGLSSRSNDMSRSRISKKNIKDQFEEIS